MAIVKIHAREGGPWIEYKNIAVICFVEDGFGLCYGMDYNVVHNTHEKSGCLYFIKSQLKNYTISISGHLDVI